MCERLPPHFFDIGHLGVGQTLSVTAGNPDSTAKQQTAVSTVFPYRILITTSVTSSSNFLPLVNR